MYVDKVAELLVHTYIRILEQILVTNVVYLDFLKNDNKADHSTDMARKQKVLQVKKRSSIKRLQQKACNLPMTISHTKRNNILSHQLASLLPLFPNIRFKKKTKSSPTTLFFKSLTEVPQCSGQTKLQRRVFIISVYL